MPLEKRHDYLSLASGRKICVPFDQFIVFSTNLEPRDLVDEAFLPQNPLQDRCRKPYRRAIPAVISSATARPWDQIPSTIAGLPVATHYEKNSRQMRFCHPRDLLHQVSVYCKFLGRSAEMSIEALDAAAKDYFSVM